MNPQTELFFSWDVLDVLADEAVQTCPGGAPYVTAAFCKEAFHQRIVLENVCETEGIIHDMIAMVLYKVDWEWVASEVRQKAKEIIDTKKLKVYDQMLKCLQFISTKDSINDQEREFIISCINQANQLT